MIMSVLSTTPPIHPSDPLYVGMASMKLSAIMYASLMVVDYNVYVKFPG